MSFDMVAAWKVELVAAWKALQVGQEVVQTVLTLCLLDELLDCAAEVVQTVLTLCLLDELLDCAVEEAKLCKGGLQLGGMVAWMAHNWTVSVLL